MEPGRDDREDIIIRDALTPRDWPQWSPVVMTGKTREAARLLSAKRRRNGARS